MTLDSAILRAANQLIEKYGDEARGYATKWAKECKEEGDGEGYEEWRRIARAVKELLSEKPPEDAQIH
tara:strand:- start:441 stop:644 length:204 start_codon:yes stop_codon:yes gene_type:complete